MDSFRHIYPNNDNNNNNRSSSSSTDRYASIPPPRFPDADPSRYLLLHSHPQHHHHRPLPPLHHHRAAPHNHTHNHPNLFLPSIHPHPPHNPTVLSPPPLIFPPRAPRVPDHPFRFREEEPIRSPPQLVWEDRLFPRPPIAIHRDSDDLRGRPLPGSPNPDLVRRKRFNSDLDGVEFDRRWRELAAEEDRIGDSWNNLRDPRSLDPPRQIRRRTLGSDPFEDFDSTAMVGHDDSHGFDERRIMERKPVERIKVQDRISGFGGRAEASPSSPFFLSNTSRGKAKNGFQVGPGKRVPLTETGKGKKTMVHENKPQKVSALLRLQGGNNTNRNRNRNRNRNDEKSLQSSYAGDSNAVPSKGKGPIVFSDDRVEKGTLPVELDVSFKSNALVAKAIFSPSKPLTGSSKKRVIKVKKKKKAVGPVSDSPSSQGPRINSKDDASSSHITMDVSEKAGVSEAGPVAGVVAANDPDSDPSQSVVLVPLENAVTPVNSVKENLKSANGVSAEDDINRLHLKADFNEPRKELARVDNESILSAIEGDQQDAFPPGTATDCEENSIEVGDKEGKLQSLEQTEVGAVQERGMGCNTAELHLEAREELSTLPLEVQSLPTRVMEADGCDQLVKEGLNQSVNNLAEAVAVPISASNSMEEDAGDLLDKLSRIDFPEPSAAHEVDSLKEDKLFWQVSDENGCMDKSKQNKETVDKDGFSLNDTDASVTKPEVHGKSDDRMLIDNHMITQKKLPLQSLTTKRSSTSSVLVDKRTPHMNYGRSGSLPPRAVFTSRTVKGKVSSTRIVRPRTWHRTDNSSASPSPAHDSGLGSDPTEGHSQKSVEKVQNPSYIRKGNSLVRKSTPAVTSCRPSHGLGTPVYQSNSASEDMLKSCMTSKRNGDSTDSYGGGNPSFERPKTPPLSHSIKSLNCMTKTSWDSSNSTLSDPPAQAHLEIPAYTAPDPIKPSRTTENQAPDSVVSNLGTVPTLNDGKLKSPKAKRVIYVKRKSNQLVAAPRPEIRDSALAITENTHAVYFKRRKNQLVRNAASSKSQAKEVIAIPDDGSNSEGQSAPEISTSKCSRGLSKRLLDKVLGKTCKPSNLSLVWTLSGSKSYHKGTTLMQRQKVLPCLFPWKRTTYRRRAINNITPVFNKSFSAPIRKLKLSRQRHTVYVRSTNGFSLRKSRVLSIGGSSLKWSKSIERRSKKASEEATLAVVAAERKKREQNRAASTAKGNDGSPSARKSAHGIELQPGERIFRVGSVRYKMDSSRRTLLRIPDEESSSAVNLQQEKSTRIPFVPRRLLIGNDEYIRIGNGNQLVRDPKKLTRILANEKIRWSLHTARLRLAKKQQYCQFFTRFGKCNKDGGKCPYIHDPAKVAVCTKFLNGRCSSSNCKLTHKVIPERMPDCSYFLQGLCTNENCPYRHVNVNPNASVCQGFLRGYCADGDECCKKHSYVCPVFESNGMCPLGSSCKLHHPSTVNKSKKRKRLKDKKSTGGRYFASLGLIDAGESKANASADLIAEQSGDIFFNDGRYTDYISLDFNDEAGETNHMMDTDAAR